MFDMWNMCRELDLKPLFGLWKLILWMQVCATTIFLFKDSKFNPLPGFELAIVMSKLFFGCPFIPSGQPWKNLHQQSSKSMKQQLLCYVFGFFRCISLVKVLPHLHHGKRVWWAAVFCLPWHVGSDTCSAARARSGKRIKRPAMFGWYRPRWSKYVCLFSII